MTEPIDKGWEQFQKYYKEYPEIGLALDLSKVDFSEDYFSSMEEKIKRAFRNMGELERGAIANPDEQRMVGHYWLRNPALAPTPEIRREIEETIAAIQVFAKQVHSGEVHGQGGPFCNLLVIGIGGSALGPQFVSHALGHPKTDRVRLFFFDNTDPDGMDRTLAQLDSQLGRTLCLVISKSGGTKETRNGMLETEAAYQKAGLSFGSHAVAITGNGSELDNYAKRGGWICRFPMWDWVGGRTSELSAVGLLPAAIQGLDIELLISGAKKCDELTRQTNVQTNPAMRMALAWHCLGNGKGDKNMVVLPYKDRLELFSKYLQQLIMESLGKEKDLHGSVVNQGLTVFGNKGSTDQHSYVQQLRDGLDNFFATFIQVLRDRNKNSPFIEGNITTGDYLNGFFLGTRRALFENGRESITITIDEVSPYSIGVLIALFERAVGFYASLININAYHQPGVEAGKKAAKEIISLQNKVEQLLRSKKGNKLTANEIANHIGSEDVESVFKICQHLSGCSGRGITIRIGITAGDTIFSCV